MLGLFLDILTYSNSTWYFTALLQFASLFDIVSTDGTTTIGIFWEIAKEFSFSDSLLRVEEQLCYMRKPNETNNEINKKIPKQ